jgi:hypothetical protein
MHGINLYKKYQPGRGQVNIFYVDIKFIQIYINIKFIDLTCEVYVVAYMRLLICRCIYVNFSRHPLYLNEYPQKFS